MNYRITLHSFEKGSPIVVNALNIACMELILDEDEIPIATAVAISGIKDSWISVRETMDTIENLIDDSLRI